jgi:UDP-N-acetylglucosamine 2-epimerase (non-hydrolysing)
MAKRTFKLVTLLGIRPDIIRMHKLLAMLDRGQSEHGYCHIYIHSGQHFDYHLDGVFYRQLGVRRPDFNLRIGRALKRSGKTSHVYQSALLLTKTADMLDKLRPDAVLYLGDTNTVISSQIVAKYCIPVLHIEGGGRSFDWRMPEEKNRIVIDHLSDVIYCYLERYKQILLAEGVPEYRIAVVGNIIVDALERFLPVADRNHILQRLGVREKQYVLCTLHREENISDAAIFKAKLRGLLDLSRTLPVVFPVMPRVEAQIRRLGLQKLFKTSRIIRTKPLGFLEFLKLEKEARLIVSDSGTVQEEALLLGVPCLITRRSTERPETIAAGATLLAEDDLCGNALRTLKMKTTWDRNVLNPMGGSPSERVFQDVVTKIHFGFFERSRRIDLLQQNPFAREAYGIDRVAIANVSGSRPEARDTFPKTTVSSNQRNASCQTSD